VVRAILSYVGRPVRVFADGAWTARPGWSGLRRVYVPGLGRRWAALCETPDLDLIPQRFAVRQEALFLAGLELAPLHLGLWLLSWPVRLGLVRDLTPLAGPLRAAAGLVAGLGSDRGGMVVLARGLDGQGRPRRARWSLAAAANRGPDTPGAPAAAVLRGLLGGEITARGACAAAGLLRLDQIIRELAGPEIVTETLSVAEDEPRLFPRVLGERFERLATEVRQVHGASEPCAYAGRGRARGSRAPLVQALRNLLRLPHPGVYASLQVTVAPDARGETWTRAFGDRAFSSRLSPGREMGQFQERFGPLRFTFEAEPRGGGFAWRFVGWRLGPLGLPRALAPRIRARAFARGGTYRFSVAAAHPWLGLLFAYAGRLR
jgi:hypothetical protein